MSDAPERKRDALSEPAAPKGNHRVVIIAASVVVVLVLVVVRVLAGERGPREVPPIAEAKLLDEAIASEIEARASVENAPTCYTTDEGFHFDYRGSRGELHTVDRIVDVPVLYRGLASCVRD